MCVVCKQSKPKDELIRIVKLQNNTFTLNPKAEGRGAYICKDNKCLDKCIKKKLLNKAYKMNISNEVYTKLLEEYAGYNQIKSYIGFAIKSKNIVYGVDNIIKLSPKFVFIDKNIGQASKRKLQNFLNKRKIECIEFDLTFVLGTDKCKAIGLKEKNLIDAIKKVLKES